jgi:adenine-specific DNA-methyltransferase
MLASARLSKSHYLTHFICETHQIIVVRAMLKKLIERQPDNMNYTAAPDATSTDNATSAGGFVRFPDIDFDKLRGGYYTQLALAEWMTSWAIQAKGDSVLEPSCGDGTFLLAAVQRLLQLEASKEGVAKSLTGVEIVPVEATAARNRIREEVGGHADSIVIESDFFEWWKQPNRRLYDSVIGNPPFIRYQTFPEPYRSRAMAIMVELGMKPNKLTNIWVPFVVASAASLKPGGRMALVIPAELLQVTYASQLRSFLMDRFDRIDIVACNELFFDNAQQEVVLLLAQGAIAEPSAKNECRVSMTEANSVKDIISRAPAVVLASAEPKTIRHDSEKWLKYFLTNKEISLMRALRDSGAVSSLSLHASVDVGVVTGKNEFFVLNSDQVKEYGLEGYTVPIISKTAQMRGAVMTKTEWQELSDAGADRVHLLYLAALNGKKLPKKLATYIANGEEAKFHLGYKCSIRKPWYVVPSVWIPDGLLFRQIYDFPRIVQNLAGATTTDTVHRLRTSVASNILIPQFYSHLTGASAEIEGRSYGGGVLELEPTEAERLLVPTVLQKALPIEEIDRLVRAGKLNEVLNQNDRLILIDGIGLSNSDCTALREIWEKMRDRRKARKKIKKITQMGVEGL